MSTSPDLESLRKDLSAKEKEARKRLNNSADEVEKKLFRALKIALLAGLGSYLVYRLFFGRSGKKIKKSSDRFKNTEVGVTGSILNELMAKTLKAGIPLVLEWLSELLKKDSKEEKKNRQKNS